MRPEENCVGVGPTYMHASRVGAFVIEREHAGFESIKDTGVWTGAGMNLSLMDVATGSGSYTSVNSISSAQRTSDNMYTILI